MQKILSFALAAVLCLSLTSCALADTVESYFATCENKAYSLDAMYVGVGEIAHLYTKNPLCGSKNVVEGKPCSLISIVRVIKSAKLTAQYGIESAKKVCTEQTYQAALTAYDAYKKIADIYKPQE